MTLKSYNNGHINGKWNLTLTQPNTPLRFWFLVTKFKPNHPPLIFNGNIVQKTSEQKHLGLILDSSLSFSSHLNEKFIKAKRIIGIIKYLSKCFPFKALNQMYKALVRSHINYCDIIYHIPPLLNQPSVGISLICLMEEVETI